MADNFQSAAENPAVTTAEIPPDNVRRLTVHGLNWTARSTVVQQVLQLGFGAVLARLVSPHDFGILGLLTVFTGFAALFTDGGLASAIVQRPSLTQRHLSSAFWLSSALGAAVMVILMVSSPLIAAFYRQSELVPVTIAFSPIFLAGGVSVVQSAVLSREMNFRKVAIIKSLSLILASVIATAMAAGGFGVWSLVFLSEGTVVIRSAMLWVSGSWKPTLLPDRDSIRDLWGFGSRVMAFNAATYWSQTADSLLIGRFVGVDSLAYYNRAFSIMILPLTTVTQTAGQVMYPALSRMTRDDDAERIRRTYLKSINLISLVIFPAMVGLTVISGPFVLTVYGPHWKPAVPLLEILCLPALLQALSATTTWLFMSMGRTDLMFRWGLASTISVVIAFIIGLHWGILGVAISWAVWATLQTVPSFAIAGRLVGVRVIDVVRATSNFAGASAVMGVAVWGLDHVVHTYFTAPERLGFATVVGAAIYFAAIYLITPASILEVREIFTGAKPTTISSGS